MGKLNRILNLRVLGVHGAALLLASGAFLVDLCVWTDADVRAGEGAVSHAGGIAEERLDWMLQLDAELTAGRSADSLRPGRVLEDLERTWKAHMFASVADSLPGRDSPLERILRTQTEHIALTLSEGDDSAPVSTPDTAKRLDRARRAIRGLSDLVPLARAARDSARSVLLVVSSVGCECELRRCENMLALHGSISADIKVHPPAVVDLIEVPPLEEVLGPMDIPYWVLFDERGYPATMVAGDSDVDDVRSAVIGWLGPASDIDD